MPETKSKIGKALVVGAGISGMRAALDLAETGYGVTLIDREENLGGILGKLDKQFPTDRCGMCKMLPQTDRDAGSQQCLRRGLFHDNIEVLTGTRLLALEGEPGLFTARLQERPRWVNPDLCTGCGLCEQACPVEVADTFNLGMGTRRAIHLPTPHAFPNSHVIDSAACTRCGACEEVCPTGAIRITWQERERFRILVVDDELIVRSSLEAWLVKEAGFSADTAGSGQEALELLGQQDYQVMFLDIKMPGMDGMEVLEKALEVSPYTEVVMMTAYATVETAVDAMKAGALDYIVKPFEPESILPKVNALYESLQLSTARKLDVGAVVLCGGVSYYDPSAGRNTLGYGSLPNVVTSLEYERLLSSSGPCGGGLTRPDNGKPVEKVAFIQCVGSRDLQNQADFCSSACCLISIKEARMTVEQSSGRVEPTIFFMDMRTCGKPYERYRSQSETEQGVRFVRSRVHSVTADRKSGDCLLRFPAQDGTMKEESFDMVVLAVGQRPADGAEQLLPALGLDVNEFGFLETRALSSWETQRPGVFVGGSFSGLKDINESVTQAGAAADGASQVLHAAGGGLAPVRESPPLDPAKYREPPAVLMAVCTCGGKLDLGMGKAALEREWKFDPHVKEVRCVDKLCTRPGLEEFTRAVAESGANRLLVGACLPRLREGVSENLSRAMGVDKSCVEVADLFSPAFNDQKDKQDGSGGKEALRVLRAGVIHLKNIRPMPPSEVPVFQRALVVGGGISGMTAALSIADHGYEVDLVEKSHALGGNLTWIARTLEGHEVAPLLETTLARVEKHPLIRVWARTRVNQSSGLPGRFRTQISHESGEEDLKHGVTILATGGGEVPVQGFGRDLGLGVMTQKEAEASLADGGLDPANLGSVVMIQCAGCRTHERHYCARVCCATALKQALAFKQANPEINVYVLYRDIMAYGFMESFYTRARKLGVIFIRYQQDNPPSVAREEQGLKVTARDPILQRPLCISADRVILAAGVEPEPDACLAQTLGVDLDEDGFVQEAEFKWRPVETSRQGVFACGLALGPRNITESMTSARAAAQRALAVISHEKLAGSRTCAAVRPSLCSLCQRCMDACPYGARFLNEEQDKVLVDTALCQGCGSCVTACPNGASILEGFRREQMLESLEAAFI